MASRNDKIEVIRGAVIAVAGGISAGAVLGAFEKLNRERRQVIIRAAIKHGIAFAEEAGLLTGKTLETVKEFTEGLMREDDPSSRPSPFLQYELGRHGIELISAVESQAHNWSVHFRRTPTGEVEGLACGKAATLEELVRTIVMYVRYGPVPSAGN